METYFGSIHTVYDVLYVVEACRLNLLRRVTRRLSDKRRKTIRAGSVFVWMENEAGLKRWTDGKSWSPSRVHGSFLIYRECYPRAKIPELGMQLLANAVSQHCSSFSDPLDAESLQIKHGHRGDYCFTPNGLYKKTISVETTLGEKYHVVYYYVEEDDFHSHSTNYLVPISADPFFKSISIPPIYPPVESPTVFMRLPSPSFLPSFSSSSSSSFFSFSSHPMELLSTSFSNPSLDTFVNDDEDSLDGWSSSSYGGCEPNPSHAFFNKRSCLPQRKPALKKMKFHSPSSSSSSSSSSSFSSNAFPLTPSPPPSSSSSFFSSSIKSNPLHTTPDFLRSTSSITFPISPPTYVPPHPHEPCHLIIPPMEYRSLQKERTQREVETEVKPSVVYPSLLNLKKPTPPAPSKTPSSHFYSEKSHLFVPIEHSGSKKMSVSFLLSPV